MSNIVRPAPPKPVPKPGHVKVVRALYRYVAQQAVSSLDPCNKKTSLVLESMKELPLYASNVVQDSEKEAYDLEIHNFQNDHFSDIVEESVDLWWRIPQNILYSQAWHLPC
ncbi:hypothetical protein AVEN_204999-1 [Araneus ventricosus]|uniref:Uncharacterized protein n=1 Tax=Araneus ventricosus TaxID=182803 RepID=A0A4Y2VZJ3_ARAVE|nr:hypothetical protein AVEN_204999-1 [Araneus ventricosus]